MGVIVVNLEIELQKDQEYFNPFHCLGGGKCRFLKIYS
jgi:hypothetical protein